MDWDEFLKASPRVGPDFDNRLRRDGFCLLATLRRDDGPRVSAVEATVVAGQLVFGMPHGSAKARDLKRDRRCVVHSAVLHKNNEDGDYKLTGFADEILDRGLFKVVQDLSERQSGWRPPFRAAFYVKIDVKSASYVNSHTGEVIVWKKHVGESGRQVARVGD